MPPSGVRFIPARGRTSLPGAGAKEKRSAIRDTTKRPSCIAKRSPTQARAPPRANGKKAKSGAGSALLDVRRNAQQGGIRMTAELGVVMAVGHRVAHPQPIIRCNRRCRAEGTRDGAGNGSVRIAARPRVPLIGQRGRAGRDGLQAGAASQHHGFALRLLGYYRRRDNRDGIQPPRVRPLTSGAVFGVAPRQCVYSPGQVKRTLLPSCSATDRRLDGPVHAKAQEVAVRL